jgi:hypothetical protein
MLLSGLALSGQVGRDQEYDPSSVRLPGNPGSLPFPAISAFPGNHRSHRPVGTRRNDDLYIRIEDTSPVEHIEHNWDNPVYRGGAGVVVADQCNLPARMNQLRKWFRTLRILKSCSDLFLEIQDWW